MARLARQTSEEEDLYGVTPTPQQGPRHTQASELRSSPASISSDKENRSSTAGTVDSRGKRRAGMLDKPPTPFSDDGPTPRSGKRRRLTDRDQVDEATQIDSQPDEIIDLQYYDPDQDIHERRRVRKGLRDLTRDLNDSRSEFLNPGSRGLKETLEKANEFIKDVRHTADATIDSRLLVTAADLSYKKTAQFTLNSSQNVDVEDFVTKCIVFMRQGAGARVPGEWGAENPAGSQRPGAGRRQAAASAHNADLSDGEAIDDGDALDWDYLGRTACFPHNTRPPTCGFLLGPLSLQKRARAQPVRRANQSQRRNPADVDRPQELKAADLEKVENSNLTAICTRIRKVLHRTQTQGQEVVYKEATSEMEDWEVKKLMARYCVADDGGVNFFNFVINPRSFGQTVENLFYVSFLIRDGSVGVGQDSDHLPTLHATSPRNIAEIKEQGVQKNQAIFHLDYKTWEALIAAFGIKKAIIEDRGSEVEAAATVGSTGWYG